MENLLPDFLYLKCLFHMKVRELKHQKPISWKTQSQRRFYGIFEFFIFLLKMSTCTQKSMNSSSERSNVGVLKVGGIFCGINSFYSFIENVCFKWKLENKSINGLKVGILGEGFSMDGADAAVTKLLKDTLNKLELYGAVLKDVSVPLHTICNYPFMKNTLEKTKRNHIKEQYQYCNSL